MSPVRLSQQPADLVEDETKSEKETIKLLEVQVQKMETRTSNDVLLRELYEKYVQVNKDIGKLFAWVKNLIKEAEDCRGQASMAEMINTILGLTTQDLQKLVEDLKTKGINLKLPA
ncbi:hypothetical protein DdX_11156 [Ditylenchus destructor]|uniref:Uncharacterized protein n=1 Tax=Ditylenchus destructor TaxID=166010 RepID=A0AAD4MXI7_9BILA|nr:hypothetical protein DdX_11156 [Ditylenchus destructor]